MWCDLGTGITLGIPNLGQAVSKSCIKQIMAIQKPKAQAEEEKNIVFSGISVLENKIKMTGMR